MRYATTVQFIRTENEKYNPATGKIESTKKPAERICKVSDLGTDRILEIYGQADIKASEVYHRGAMINANRLIINGKPHEISRKQQVRNKAIYIAREVRHESQS